MVPKITVTYENSLGHISSVSYEMDVLVMADGIMDHMPNILRGLGFYIPYNAKGD